MSYPKSASTPTKPLSRVVSIVYCVTILIISWLCLRRCAYHNVSMNTSRRSYQVGNSIYISKASKIISKITSISGVFAMASNYEYDDVDDDEDDVLAEILAEEQREAEELEQLEAQMRELDELKSQQQRMKQNQHKHGPKGGMGGKKPMGSNKNKKFSSIEEDLMKKEAQAREAETNANAEAQAEINRRNAEEIAKQREAAFQAELKKAKDTKARKDLERRKAEDEKIVKRVLKNSKQDNHYAVLGFFRCKMGEINLGPFKICNLKDGQIKRAYRKMARLVHPDKNKDGRAGEAFDALEKSSAVLLDDQKRMDYDYNLKLRRKDTFQNGLELIDDLINSGVKVLQAMRLLLGPFSTPIVILLLLII
mmetsp:Transcript_24294/g.29885  ORF Transcript_24294/g.29885 Transcript_24294/m.29885 type:complete len:366 (+) Transcript_24294:46-1143(+)